MSAQSDKNGFISVYPQASFEPFPPTAHTVRAVLTRMCRVSCTVSDALPAPRDRQRSLIDFDTHRAPTTSTKAWTAQR